MCSTLSISNPLPLKTKTPMTTIDTTNDHLTFGEIFEKATTFLLSVDSLSAIEVPFKGEMLRFEKRGSFITLLPAKK